MTNIIIQYVNTIINLFKNKHPRYLLPLTSDDYMWALNLKSNIATDNKLNKITQC